MRWSAALGSLVLLGSYVGCGYPSYTYDDNAFYDASAGASGGAGGSSAGGGSSGTGATAGSGGSITGGSGGVGGSTGGSGGSSGGAGGSTAGAGGTAGSGGGTAGSGGGTGTENCTNGKDDDGDGKIDCLDPDCQGPYMCAPAVLSGGWLGPVAVWQGTPGSEPSCFKSGDYVNPAASGNAGVQAGNWSCQTCSCGSPTGGSCSSVNIEYYDTTACDQGCWGCSGTPFTLTDGAACKVFGEIHGSSGQTPKAAMFTTPTASGSTCAPQGVTPTFPNPTWQTSMVACSGAPTTGKGCGTTSACIQVPKSPFGFTCMYLTGDNPCPAGPYSHKHLYYTGFSDTRACSNCTCGAPSGQSCTGTVKTYTDTCVSNVTTMTTPNQCTTIPPDNTTATYDGGLEDTRGATYTGGTPTGGSCTPGGGQKSGGVTGSNPITFCCL